ncbi:MAG: tRNA (adenosine(37)-N6)-threonylcarbamoyltransferase complex dimerization subunit type 1 TsaB [Planctomycetota bacterium]
METSGRVGSLAALSAESDIPEVVENVTLPKSARSAKSLIPAAQSLLRNCGWSSSELDLICVASGPGSFTGLRIGVTVAKTLAYATGASLVETNTLAVIAAGISARYDRLWTIVDAQRGDLFAAKFEHEWQSEQSSTPPTTIVPAARWIDQLEPGDLIAGPPLSKMGSELPSGIRLAGDELWEPQAEYVGRLGIQQARWGNTIETVQLVPQYFRKSAAEEKVDLESHE